jgi:glycolate oxidase iron-sulfur subunit
MTEVFAEADLNKCVSCGLCLGACTTFRATGLETASPRGRIEAMRAVADGSTSITDPTFGRLMDECVQCRACEAVCPSGAPFGLLMEQARVALHEEAPSPATERAGSAIAFRLLLRYRILLLAASVVAAVLQLLRIKLPFSRVRIRDVLKPLRAGRGTDHVWFFRGCVMDVLQRPVHQATVDVLERAALGTHWPSKGLCCGALHLHQGRREEAKRFARRVIDAFPGDDRIVVNSAGCGAAMKEYGELLGTPDAEAFALRVVDFSEVEELHQLRTSRTDHPTVGYQHACHLRNVQRVIDPPLHLLREVAGFEVVEGREPQVCCGAGGAYKAFQPDLSNAAGQRKAEDLAGCDVVVTTNPGCHMHLAAHGLPMRHLAEVLRDRL